MFEAKTYAVILTDMLARVSSTLDKRQGSIIYDALAPCAVELAQAYIDLDIILDNAFVDTATGDYLDMRCSELGLTRTAASYTVQTGVFTGSGGVAFNVSIGDRFSAVNTTLNFIVTEKIADGQFKLQAETSGIVGNTAIGQVLPITYITGLETATLSDILIYGEAIETDDSLRARYFLKVQNISKDGNKAQYTEWALAYSGIGRAKVFSLWNGANSVKVSILDANYDIATSTLISDFQTYLDPSSAGLGEGIAPIGAICTVSTASHKDIAIAATVTITDGYTLLQAKTAAETAIKAYFTDEVNYIKSSVSYFKLGAILSSLSQIKSVTVLAVNGSNIDITLLDEEIPNLSTLTLSV